MTLHDTSSPTSASITLKIIGTVDSCYPDKFGIPRQPGLAPEATARLRLSTPFDHPDCLRGLEQFSHLWITFIFHQSPKRWTPLIRPPRLGGNTRIGVFASRSTHRPNRLGLSLVELAGIEYDPAPVLILRGHDLVDGTPVVDIKPYLPWADSAEHARAGFAPEPPPRFDVRMSDECRQRLKARTDGESLGLLIREVLSQDPRPAYRRNRHDDRGYGVRLHDLDVRFHIETVTKASGDGVESVVVVDTLVPMT